MSSVSNFKNLANINAYSHALESHVTTCLILYIVYDIEQKIELQLMSNKLIFLALWRLSKLVVFIRTF